MRGRGRERRAGREGERGPQFALFSSVWDSSPQGWPYSISMGLLSLVNPLWKFSHKCDPRYASWVTLNPLNNEDEPSHCLYDNHSFC